MTKKFFKEQMLRISKIDDEEERHGDADDLLCQALIELGYSEGVEIFVKMDKWYA